MRFPVLRHGERPRPRRLSEVLSDIANDPARDEIAFADLREAMGDRSFGALLFVFAVPNTLPVNIPGVSTLLGLPLLFLAFQLIVGSRAPWLPQSVMARSVKRASFAAAMNRAVPWIRRAERLLRPRLQWLATRGFDRVVGLVIAVLAFVLMLPIPFGNTLPAIAVCILALALLEEDGLATLAGLVVAAGALFVVWGVILGIVKAVSLFLRHLLGA